MSRVLDARPTRARIRLDALRANFALAQRLAGAAEVIPVVKADAYGHGARAVAPALVAAGARRLAVLTLGEAVELREAGVGPEILLLGGLHDLAEAEAAAALPATPVVHHAGHVALLRRVAERRGRPVALHVEVDSGMRRMGVPPEEAPKLLAEVAGDPALALTGLYTQLARADEPELGPAREQLRSFGALLGELARRGIDPGLVHVANSATLLAASRLGDALPPAGGVRPGLLLYGVSPAPHLEAALEPVMTLETRVAHVRRVAPGDAVGYGGSFRAPHATRIATLPLGYADGVPWSLGNRGCALLGGRRVPIVGRISMDFVTLDVGEAPVEIGDPATLFGGEPEARLPVEELARLAGTIPYELLVRIGARVPRVFVDGQPPAD